MNFISKLISLVILGILTWLTILVPLQILIKLKPHTVSYYALFPVFIIIYFVLTCQKDKCVSNLTSFIFRKVFLFGSIGLVGGFIGQIFLTPKSVEELGLLWPFLFTIPFGVIVGITWGFIQWFIVEKKGNYLVSLLQLLIIFSVVFISFFFFKMAAYLIVPFPYHFISYNISWILSVGVGWLAWKKLNTAEKNKFSEEKLISKESLISNVVLGALILGGTVISLGIYGSLLINPHAEQAILWVLFAPVGFVIGAMFGLAVGKRKSKSWNRLLWSCAIVSVTVIISAQIRITWDDSKKSSYIQHPSDLQKRDSTLRYLNVRVLSDDDLLQLQRFKNLHSLNFASGWASFDAKLTDVGLKNLSEMKLPNLGALSLGHCSRNITDEGMKYVANIPTLKHIGLATCPQITNAGLFNLSNSDSIKTIDLRGCDRITNRGLLFLSRMPKLYKLRLGGCTNVTMHGIKELQKVSPNIFIEKDDEEWAYRSLPLDQKIKFLQQKRTKKTSDEFVNLDFNLSQNSMQHQPKKIFPEKFNQILTTNSTIPLYSAWATVTPTIDGVISDGEWDDADRADDTFIFSLKNKQIIESHHAICLVKNDAHYLYIALIVKDDDYQIYPVSDGIDIFFYKTIGDSPKYMKKSADDIFSISINGRKGDFNMNHPQTSSKPNLDKIQNLDAAVSHSNPLPDAIGDYVFELRHPWHGHDKLDDIQLAEGDTVVFRIRFADGLPTGGSLGYNFPNTGFAKITIKSNQSEK